MSDYCKDLIRFGSDFSMCLEPLTYGSFPRAKTVEEFLAYWIVPSHGCPESVSNFINSSPTPIPGNCTIQYNKHAADYARKQVDYFLKQYTDKYEFTDSVTNPKRSPLQEVIVEMCRNPTTPGICDSFLTPFCKKYNREQISSSNILTSLCGCYTTPDPEFQKYAKGTPGCLTGVIDVCHGCTSNDPNCVSIPACDPLCKLPGTVKQVSSEGRLLTCPQNVCVIDNVIINDRNSQIPGGINFNTICSGCSDGAPGTCLCVINSPQTTLAKIGVASYIQMCGEESTCLVDGSLVPCSNFSPENLPKPPAQINWVWGLLFLGLIIFGLVLLVGILIKFS